MNETVFHVTKFGLNYETYIPAGITGEEVEKGLAIMINGLVEREQKSDPTFTSFRLIRGVEQWLQQLEENQ